MIATMTNINRDLISGFDLLKFAMALVIVNIHAQLILECDSPYLQVLWKYVEGISVPTFFVLSSYFLFRKQRMLTNVKGGAAL